MCDYKLPDWPSTNIHWDVESMSHTASAVEAAGHGVSGGCSGWETCPSASLPVQSNTHFHYTNTDTHAQTETGWTWKVTPVSWLTEAGHCQVTLFSGHWPFAHPYIRLVERGGGGILFSCQNHLLPVDSQATVFPGIWICDCVSVDTNVSAFTSTINSCPIKSNSHKQQNKGKPTHCHQTIPASYKKRNNNRATKRKKTDWEITPQRDDSTWNCGETDAPESLAKCETERDEDVSY